MCRSRSGVYYFKQAGSTWAFEKVVYQAKAQSSLGLYYPMPGVRIIKTFSKAHVDALTHAKIAIRLCELPCGGMLAFT